MNSNHEPIKQFAKSAILMTGLAAAIATISGCGAESDEQANNAPYAEGVNFTVQTQSETNYTLPAEDADGDTLEYTLVSEPTIGQATLDSATGEMTYISGSIVGTDEFMIEVSDGEDSVMATVSIQVQSDAVFNYQFYSVPNPETTNSQIVRYDPNNPDNETNQQVIKDNIILGSQVFAISAAKDGNKTVYEKREYGFYLDPNASSETRTADDGEGGVFEYEFYTNNIFKRFEADNPAAEAVVFTSTMLGSDLGGQGLAAVGDTYDLYLNPTDIDNSYAELRAYSHLPDTFRGETSDGIKNTFVTVRLADSAFVQGRTVQPVVNDSTGATDKVLVNYLAVTNHDGSYPEDESEAAHLQVCDAALTNCESLGELALGEFYFKAQNADYIYLNKEGSDSYYAFNKADDSFAEVTGANFPAPFEAIRHTIQKGLGHGGGGILQDFSSLTIVNGYLAEDDVAYALVNYNLDLQDPVWMFYGYYPQYTFKNAMVVQFEGTTATKIYDNGTGVDLGDESDEVPVNNQINLTAVIDGNLYVELGRYDTENAVNILSTG